MKADKRQKRLERGKKQKHASRGNAHRRREWDTIEDKQLYAKRRVHRNMGDETLELEQNME
jgi:hypothetical protein